MQKGADKNNGRITLFGAIDFLCIMGNFPGVPYSFKISTEISFHLNANPVLKRLTCRCFQFIGQGAQALFGMGAVSGTSKVNFRVKHAVAAFAAGPGTVILEKFDKVAAFRAFYFENCCSFPVAAVLSGAFHYVLLGARVEALNDKQAVC
jgi:hypothetical protein